MEDKQYAKTIHFMDKDGLPGGLRLVEPDVAIGHIPVTETLELPFLIRRDEMGFLLGYVGVPDDSPLAGMDFDDVNGLLPQGVHGNLTYSGELKEARDFDILKNHYFFGFDCAHAHDVVPALLNPVRPSFEDDPLIQQIQEVTEALCESLGTSMEELKKEVAKHARYRDLAYVLEECMRLACQLGEILQNLPPLPGESR